METKNLQTFVHVAETGSFTKAAEKLGYTQSTVSFQIKQLENELGCLVFERINHTITLTDAGQSLMEYAHKIFRLSDEFKENMNKANMLKGYIHVVTPDSVCEDMLTTNYLDFNKHYPDIRLRFTTADTETMFEMLDKNQADVIITLDNHIYQNNYVIAKEEHVCMNFVTNAKSDLAGKKNLSIIDLLDRPFILTERRMSYRRILDIELAKKSIEIAPNLEVGRPDIIANILSESDGISFLPDFVTEEKVKAGKLAYIDVQDVKIDMWKQLIYHKNKWISNCMRAFIEYVKTAEFKQCQE